MLERAAIENKVIKDFNSFDFADKPMQHYCGYNWAKHISMATQLVMNAFAWKECYSMTEVDDFIHGLNHVFFNGVAAGQNFEWERNKKNED